MNDSGTHIKTAVFVVLGFVACAILGQQISLQVIPSTGWSPYCWFVFCSIGGLIGVCFAETV